MPKPLICSLCQEEILPENYFNVKIRNEESRIGHQHNACRECLMDGLFDLPPNNAEEAKRTERGR